MVWCVIPAAGSGARMGAALPKQYLPLLGKPMLLRTMERLARHPGISGLMVVLAPTDPYWPGLVLCEGKPVRTAPGGELRADSVRNGLLSLASFLPAESWVLVHDAARPAVRGRDISRLIEAAAPHPVGAILAVPLVDTLKRATASLEIECTEPRENLWRALTPQMFRLGELIAALGGDQNGNVRKTNVLTDDANALELAGKKPLLVDGCNDNLKVTRAEDLPLMEAILRAQGEQ